MSIISVVDNTLTSFIDIASAPAYLNSFTRSIKSYASTCPLPSLKVTTIPSPYTSVFPTNIFDSLSSSSINSDAASLSSMV